MEEAGTPRALCLPSTLLPFLVECASLEDRVPLPLIVLFLHKYLQYVVVSSKKILFYNDEQDKEQSNPSMVLDIE